MNWYSGLLVVSSLFAYPLIGVAVPSSSQIDFSEMSYDFGEIKRGETVTHDFKFKNIGDADLILTGVHAACGCTVAEFTSGKSYKPGEGGHVRIIFDSKNFSGPITKSVAIMTNEVAKHGRNLTIKARIAAELAIDPPLVNFGEAKRGEFSEKLIQISPTKDINPLSLEFDPKLVSAELRKVDNGWVVSTKLVESQLSAGHFRGRIYLITNSKILPKIEIPLRAEVLGSFKTSPSYLEFGNIAIGASAERKISVEYLAGQTITSMSSEINLNGNPVEDASSIVSLKKSDDGKTIVAALSNNAALNGSAHGKIILQTSDVGQKQLRIDFYAFFGNVR